MKNLFKYSLGFLFAALALTACSPDSFSGADANGIPTMNGVDFEMTVDQETNQMIASYSAAPGTYPVWILNGTSYSTLPEVGYTNTEAGTYTVEMRLGNRNGISQAGLKKTFTFNETKVDYTADFRRLCGKEWRIANKEAGHMGCGPAGTAGTEWWAAGPNDKKDFGVYDDRITFTNTNLKGGGYTYSAGADGLTYVNKGTTWAAGASEDVDVELGDQTATWSFEVYDWKDAEGVVSKQTFIQLASNTLFPYISSDAQYADPKFRIETLTATKLVLVYDAPDGSIAWRYVLTSAADERLVEEQGFDANSDFNLWKGVTPSATFHFAPGWCDPARTGEMEVTYNDKGNDYTVTVPDACNDRWQAQFHLHTTDVAVSASNHYDFSCIFVSDVDIDNVTVKVTNESDSEAIIDEAKISLKAGKEYVFWKSDVAGKDLSPVKVVFDFGFATAPTTINVSNIVLKDHANDDGTKVPEEGGEGGEEATKDWDASSAANLWKAVESGDAFIKYTTWFANNDWQGLPNQPTVNHADGKWSFAVPEGTGSQQWQGQFAIETTLTALKAKKYNFYLVLEADADIPGATIKLTETNYSDTDKRDDNFFFADRHDITADKPFVYKAEAVELAKDDAHALSLVFDFGGAPAGTNVTISDIYFEEAVTLDYDDANNLWKGVDEGTDYIKYTTWFADNNWTGLPNQPAISHNGKVWEFDIPEGIGSQQWQGQFAIETELATLQNDPYNFSCTITADMDLSGVTIKLTETNYSDTDKRDDNFYFADRHDSKADEPFVYTMKGVTLPKGDAHALSLVFDFGGSPAGAHVKISDIIFEKAQ